MNTTTPTELPTEELAQELNWLPVADLRIDHRYQRPLDLGRVRRMAREFDYDAFGVLLISRRDDGSMWVIDGQHRVALIHEIGWGDQTVPCLVHLGLTMEAEARIFRKANSGSRPNSLALFRAELAEGGPEATDIALIVRRCGLQIGPSATQGTIQAASALRKVYRNAGGLILERVLRHIIATWGNSSTNFQADILLALALVEKRHHKTGGLNDDRLRRTLSTVTPNSLMAAARATKLSGAGNLWAEAMPEQILGLYNKGLRTGRIGPWERRTNAREVWT